MNKLPIQLLVLLLSCATCYPQTTESFPSIDNNDLPEGKFIRTRIFKGESLFGYIDGGAELFLEYGFSAAWVTEIDLMGGKYKTEIYSMGSPEEAFGIFSVSKFRCNSMPPVSSFSCQTRYQLQICAGSFYISIINSSGSKTDSVSSLRIGEAIVGKITEPSVNLSGYLPGIPIEYLKSHAVLAKGKLGLINGAPDWEDFFKEATGYCVVILKGDEKTILSIRFDNQEGLVKFTSLHNWKLEDISNVVNKFTSGESVSKLSDNHLFIEIPK